MSSDADTAGTAGSNGPGTGGGTGYVGGGVNGGGSGTPRTTTTGETFFGPDFNPETAALKLGINPT